MNSLIDLAFTPINTPLSVLLIFLTAYRLITLVLGMDFDFDLDFDIDIDSSFDPSSIGVDDVSNLELKNKSIAGSSQKKLKWWQIILVYFNFSELPFLFTFTAWIFFWWLLTLVVTYYTNSYDNFWGLIIFILAIIPSLIINKIFTNPFKSLFKKLERKGVKALDLLGRKGVLLSNISSNKLGSAKLFVENDPINIYVKSINGETIETNTEILIIKQSKDSKYYYVKSYNLI